MICLIDGRRHAIRTDDADGVDSTRHGCRRNKHLLTKRLDAASSVRCPASLSGTILDLFVTERLSTVPGPGETEVSWIAMAQFRPYDGQGAAVALFRPRIWWTSTAADWRSEGGVAETGQSRRSAVLLDLLGHQYRMLDGHVHPHPTVVLLVAEYVPQYGEYTRWGIIITGPPSAKWLNFVIMLSIQLNAEWHGRSSLVGTRKSTLLIINNMLLISLPFHNSFLNNLTLDAFLSAPRVAYNRS